jgi:polysaccharide export outer membrane protein
MRNTLRRLALTLLLCGSFAASVAAQAPASAPPGDNRPSLPSNVDPPTGYVIGTDDVLSIVFWREKDMSADVVVRPDGKISLPLLNDLSAAGLTPDQLRAELVSAARKLIEAPNVSVIVKAVNSRKVHILGNVLKAGTYPLNGDLTVLQLIALAGGLQEWADSKNIRIMRKEDGRDVALKCNYKDVVRQKNLDQNVPLRPGDTVFVP